MAIRCRLVRFDSGDQGTFAVLQFLGGSLFVGELPDRGNAPNLSRILPGLYRCVLTWSPRFRKYYYLLLDVAGRAGIRIHPANLMGDVRKKYRSQLNGCISLGERLGWIDGQKAVLLSAPAVRNFMTALGGQPFELEVV